MINYSTITYVSFPDSDIYNHYVDNNIIKFYQNLFQPSYFTKVDNLILMRPKE